MNTLAEILECPLDKIPREHIPALLLKIASLQTALAERLFDDAESVGTQRNPDKLLEIKAASVKLAVTEDWLYRHSNSLPFTIRMGRRKLRFSEQGIEKYIRQKSRH